MELLHQDPIQSTFKSGFLPFFQWSVRICGPNTDTSTCSANNLGELF